MTNANFRGRGVPSRAKDEESHLRRLLLLFIFRRSLEGTSGMPPQQLLLIQLNLHIPPDGSASGTPFLEGAPIAHQHLLSLFGLRVDKNR